MAIYSLNVATVGKSTHMPGTAGAHLRYIGRTDAARHVEAEHMPDDPQQARTWMDQHEANARKNARLLTKIRVALPRELDHTQRTELLRETVREMTGGRVPWFAVIHDRGRDAHNPHAHIAVIDRDIETGKRVLRLSDGARERRKAGLPENGVEAIRAHWEDKANHALARAGREERIDRRSLEARGIDRTPQIHIGPRANHIERSVQRPESRQVPDPTPKHPERVIDYPAIDAGRTRREHCAAIIDLNLERAARAHNFETRVWAQFERDQRSRDRRVEQAIDAGVRKRTQAERQLRRDYAARLRDVQARERAACQLGRDWLRQRHNAETQTLRERHRHEKADLDTEQKRLMGRFLAAVDVTGRTRTRRAAARQALTQRHRRERRTLADRLRQERIAQGETVSARYAPERDDLIRNRDRDLARMRDQHAEQERCDEQRLQDRAREREQAMRIVRQQIANWKKLKRERDTGRGARQAGGEHSLSQAWTDSEPGSDDDSTQTDPHKERIRRERERKRARTRGRGFQ